MLSATAPRKQAGTELEGLDGARLPHQTRGSRPGGLQNSREEEGVDEVPG